MASPGLNPWTAKWSVMLTPDFIVDYDIVNFKDYGILCRKQDQPHQEFFYPWHRIVSIKHYEERT